MIIKKISVSFEYKKALPNYENVTGRAGVEIDIEECDFGKENEAFDEAWVIVKNEVKRQIGGIK